jgi:hypothetical protein
MKPFTDLEGKLIESLMNNVLSNKIEGKSLVQVREKRNKKIFRSNTSKESLLLLATEHPLFYEGKK